MEGFKAESTAVRRGGDRNAGLALGKANTGTGKGDEQSHAEPGMTLEKLEEELKKIKARLKKIEKILKEQEKEYDFSKWEGTD